MDVDTNFNRERKQRNADSEILAKRSGRWHCAQRTTTTTNAFHERIMTRANSAGGLKRTLGLPALSFYGTGIIIGAGIYSIIGAATAEAGEAIWMSFLVSSAIALLTGLSYAELTTMYPEAGAEYVYLREAVPKAPWLAFFTGFILVLAGSATASAVALSFAAYLVPFVAMPEWIIAVALIIACTTLAVIGISESSWVNIVFTIIEIGGLILIIVGGVQSPTFGEALTTPLHTGVLAGSAVLFFVYLGFEEIANLAGEAKNTARDLPRAIFISLAATTVLYLLVSLAAVALVPVAEIAGSESAMSVAARRISPATDRILSAVALFATTNTALISIIATSRIIYAMASDHQLPRPLARILPRRKTPWLATMLVCSVALALLPLGGVATVASVSSLASLLAFVAVNATVIILRRRKPRHTRPFRVPWTLGRVPILSALGAVACVALMTQFEPVVYLVCSSVAAAGLLLYWLWNRSSATGKPAR